MADDTTLETLRDREEFYRAMFEVNTAIKLLIDPVDGSIIDANPAAATFYGWPLDELRRMNIRNINVLTDAELAIEMERARTLQSTAFHFRHRTQTGEVRDVDVYSGPVTLRGRELLLSIIHDVTERNRLEEQLRRTQRLDAIDRLAAGIAHDFNNLLTIALASVELAERKLTPDHAARDHLADVKRTVQHGADLTRQILTFARRQVLAPVPLELAAMITRIVPTLQRVLGDRIIVSAEVPAQLPLVRVDPGQLELAFLNLALNARDAMPDGGRLTLSAEVIASPGEPGRAATRSVAEVIDGRVRVCMADTGHGMDAETRARAFEPFYTTKPIGAGTGLGLATVYGLVSQSGGELAIDSSPGTGTRIYLSLPIMAPDVAVPTVTHLPRPARTVVLVEDRDDVRAALATALADVGLVVYPAAGALAALAQLAELAGTIDVVLSDVSMPERSGIELAADVHARWPGLPVVLMSGDATRHDRSRSSIAGWLQKPFTIDDVVAELDRVTR